jgi:hypothetical protein
MKAGFLSALIFERPLRGLVVWRVTFVWLWAAYSSAL